MYEGIAERARDGFTRFWNSGKQFCFDVIDAPGSPDGNDASLRPNQIFAVSLPESALTSEQQRAVVDVCAHELLTSFGLRSLARNEPAIAGSTPGIPKSAMKPIIRARYGAGLLGPFALAHLRVYRNAAEAMSFLEPMFGHLRGRRTRHGRRNFRWRSALHAEWLHCPGMDGWGNPPRLARDFRGSRKVIWERQSPDWRV